MGWEAMDFGDGVQERSNFRLSDVEFALDHREFCRTWRTC